MKTIRISAEESKFKEILTELQAKGLTGKIKCFQQGIEVKDLPDDEDALREVFFKVIEIEGVAEAVAYN